LSSASRWVMPRSRAFSRMAPSNPISRLWIVSGELMGPSSSRSCISALKHSDVAWLTVSMALAARARNGQQLQLDPLGIEGRGEVDRHQPVLQDALPVVVPLVQHEIGQAGADRDLRGRAV